MAATAVLPRADNLSENRGTKRKNSLKRGQLESIPPSDDPLRILAPGQKKLITIESQRVLAVMDMAIKRLDGAMAIPILANSQDKFSVSLGSELVKMLQEHTHLVSEYNTLYECLELEGITPNLNIAIERSGENRSQNSSVHSLEQPTFLEPLVKEESTTTMEENFQQIRARLRHNVKCILREISKHPSASSFLFSSPQDRSLDIIQLQKEMGLVHCPQNYTGDITTSFVSLQRTSWSFA